MSELSSVVRSLISAWRWDYLFAPLQTFSFLVAQCQLVRWIRTYPISQVPLAVAIISARILSCNATGWGVLDWGLGGLRHLIILSSDTLKEHLGEPSGEFATAVAHIYSAIVVLVVFPRCSWKLVGSLLRSAHNAVVDLCTRVYHLFRTVPLKLPNVASTARPKENVPELPVVIGPSESRTPFESPTSTDKDSKHRKLPGTAQDVFHAHLVRWDSGGGVPLPNQPIRGEHVNYCALLGVVGLVQMEWLIVLVTTRDRVVYANNIGPRMKGGKLN